MLRIAYCEDESAQAQQVKSFWKEWSKAREINCQVEIFQNAESFLFAQEPLRRLPYDMLLLDIRMKEMDGFELAKNIRTFDSELKIVFLTSDPGYVFEGYEVAAWRYLLKPVTKQKLFELGDALAAEQGRRKPSVLLEQSGEQVRVDLDEVLSVEVCGHYTTICLTDGEKLEIKQSFAAVLGRLNEAAGAGQMGRIGSGREATQIEHIDSSVNAELEPLPTASAPRFIRCHRSAAVNLEKIVRIGKQSCQLEGKVELPVSRGMYRELNQAFIRENLRHE